MAELAFQERSSSRAGYSTARDTSPDSVIFTLDSNLSIFSSASASVDRYSFASDAYDRDSPASETSLLLAGRDGGSGGGGNELLRETSPSGSDPNKLVTTPCAKQHAHNRSTVFNKVENDKGTVRRLLEVDDDTHLLDSARNSFSAALRECQERRCRAEAVSKNTNVNASASPRLVCATKKSAISLIKSGSPVGTPKYKNSSVGLNQKGCGSERVALQNNYIGSNTRQQMNASLLLPFTNSRRTLPSKWEDAERWIVSPGSGDRGMRTCIQREPKSKSGPLAPPGSAAVLASDACKKHNFTAASAGGLGIPANGYGDAGFPLGTEPCIGRSVSVNGCSQVLVQSSWTSPEEKVDGVQEESAGLPCVSTRNMATQMSPECGGGTSISGDHSSPSMTPSLSASTPSISPMSIIEMQSVNSSKSQARNVPVDEMVTVTRWFKKQRFRNQRKNSQIVNARSSAWDVSEASKTISKVEQDEAKITAWENLQKAKAEAAIRKLEMKIEKKRSSSMEKIMNKLRAAQKRAQEMRRSVLAKQARQVSRTSHKASSFRRTCQFISLSGCFTCHAF